MQLSKDLLAVVDTDGIFTLFKAYYRVSQGEIQTGNISTNGESDTSEDGIKGEAKILPDVMPPQKKIRK